jgi:hypothetical protein
LAGTVVSQQYGLLTNGALVVVLLQTNGFSKSASHEAGFDRVPGQKLCA